MESAASAAILVVLKPSFQAKAEAKGENSSKRYWYGETNLEHRLGQPLTINFDCSQTQDGHFETPAMKLEGQFREKVTVTYVLIIYKLYLAT